ncbi:Microcystin-dependent protein [Myxococcus fulvus]|uniref:Microcystin-dependent protein n=1 Tax=Myxococcus fulvus TaxID=33 RepID=A0A511T0V3_MYXFU|nr:tail fiber protein [Myxococcus fulvus]AKF79208.1 microcystin dependent protein [Myxococcus fulvus 124B02]GEN07780.1 tail Collar domain-containing protein [Myxococcus fulvus]SES80171.1 Microcystin-dependent protein [Myxococcus fulvus]
MSEPYIGEIRMFAGNFAPRGWAFCQGQILSIAQNTALFSILGTTYGGNGQTTFALPDLRGRYPMQPGQGPGLSPRTLGEQGGSETVTLISTQMPAHTHSLNVSSQQGDTETPVGTVLAADNAGAIFNYRAAPIDGTMNPAAIGVAGGSQPHNNMSPFLCINFIIALEGIFPSRN